MPDKKKFVGELARVCAPNGRILIVTWCHRNLKENETELKEDEQKLLKRICDAYYLPRVVFERRLREAHESGRIKRYQN